LIKELTPQEISQLCQAQTQLVETRALFAQRRQQLEAQIQVNRLPFLYLLGVSSTNERETKSKANRVKINFFRQEKDTKIKI